MVQQVWVVMERGEELPDSLWDSEEAATKHARQRGSEEDVTVQMYELKKAKP